MSGGTSSVFLPPPPPAKCVTFGPAPGAFSPKPPPAPLPLDMVLATRPSFFDLPSASAWDLSALSIISDMALDDGGRYDAAGRWTTEAGGRRGQALPTRGCGWLSQIVEGNTPYLQLKVCGVAAPSLGLEHG